MKHFKIKNFNLGKKYQPYVIAEIGVNHEGDINLAKKMIEEVSSTGANAVKFQTYKADTLASKNSPAYWDIKKEKTKSQYLLFKKYDAFNKEEYIELINHCKKFKVDFLSTPFDLNAVKFLSKFVPAFKISSSDITNIPLMRACAQYKKPIILSCGASTIEEIHQAVKIINKAGNNKIILLHCVLNYPTPIANANMNALDILKNSFKDYYIGYSDHITPADDMPALEIAVLNGAAVIEKHYTNNKNLPGNDHYHAMDKDDLSKFIKKIETYKKLLGKEFIDLSSQKKAIVNARRSIFSARDIKKGEIINNENIIAKRPGNGISTIHWDNLIGKKINCNIDEDQLLSWEMINNL